MPKTFKYTPEEVQEIEFNASRFLIQMLAAGAANDRPPEYVVAEAIEYAEVFKKKINKLAKEEI